MIRLNDDTLLSVRRRLAPHTTHDEAMSIHKTMETDKLVKGADGWWYCCNVVPDVSYTEHDIPIVEEIVQDFDQQGLS